MRAAARLSAGWWHRAGRLGGVSAFRAVRTGLALLLAGLCLASPVASQTLTPTSPAPAAVGQPAPPPADQAPTAWLEDTAARLLQAGQAAQALPLAEAALRQREAQAATAPPGPASAAAARILLAEVLQQLGRSAEAERLADAAWQALQGESGHPAADAHLRLHLRHRWALLAEQRGDEAAALAALGAVRQGWQALPGAPRLPLLAALRDEAGLRAQGGQVAAAQRLLAQAEALLTVPPVGGLAVDPADPGGQAESRLATRLQIDQAELLLRLGDAPGAARALAALADAPAAVTAERPRQDQIDLLRAQAAAARLQGEAGAALAHLARARALAEADPAMPAALRAGLLAAQAEVHRSLGDFPPARALGQAGLALRQASLPPQHPDIAQSHNNLGLTALESGDLPGARQHLVLAQGLWRSHPGRQTEAADTALNLAGLAAAEGRWADVADTLAQVLAQWRPLLDAQHPRVAVALGQRAEALSHLGQPAQRAEADALFTQALATLQLRPDLPVARGMAWARWADHQQRQGRPDLAILGGKQAVNAFQGLRARLAQTPAGLGPGAVVALDPALTSLQTSLVRQRQPVYLNLAARLLDAGRLAEAEVVAGMLKHDELADLLRGDLPGGAVLQVAEPVGAEQAAIALSPESAGHTARRALQWEALRQLDKAGALPEARRAELAAARAEVQAARDRHEAWLASLPRLLQPLNQARRDEVVQLQLDALDDLQGVLRRDLPPGTVLLHFLVLDDSLRILITAPQLRQAFQVGVSRHALNQAIVELRRAMRDRDPVEPMAQQLHRWLIAPVQPVLDTLQARVLMVAPTDNLRYLPFASLHDGQAWLVERYALSQYNAAASSKLTSVPSARWQVQAFGTTRAHPPLAALPGVRNEVEAIVGPQGLPGRVQLDERFTLAALQDTLDDRVTVLHLASHFVFRPGSEGGSFLLLGDGSRLSLQAMRRLSFQGADLVALSACDTAMGGGLGEHGAEVEGLAALVQRRDAKAVLATLWPVSDASTAALMQRFYRLRGTPQAPTKADALRQAQLSFIRGQADASPETRHPFYWAPFVLMGNWL